MFQEYPYTNYHDINLDWIIKVIQELNDKFNGSSPVLTEDNIVNTKGTQVDKVVSQNAVTEFFDELDDIYIDKTRVVSSSDITPSQGLIYDSVAVTQLTGDLTTGYLKKSEIVQNLGNNTTVPMSQKAVTDALSEVNNTRQVILNFSENVTQGTSFVGTLFNLTNLPAYQQTANIVVTPNANPSSSALSITSRDLSNNVIDTHSFLFNGLNPVNFPLTIAANAGTIRLTGQAGQSFTLDIQVTLSQIIDSTLLQTTGTSTTQAMSQKAVTDAINDGYNVMLIDNSISTHPGIYEAYEKNTEYIFKYNTTYFCCGKSGNYKLQCFAATDLETHVELTINSDDSVTLSYPPVFYKKTNDISTTIDVVNNFYTASAINSVLPTYQSIIVGGFSASSALGNLNIWVGNTTDSLSSNVMYFPTGINTIQAVGTFIYGFKKAGENTIRLITTSAMPASSSNFSLEVFKVVVPISN